MPANFKLRLNDQTINYSKTFAREDFTDSATEELAGPSLICMVLYCTYIPLFSAEESMIRQVLKAS